MVAMHDKEQIIIEVTAKLDKISKVGLKHLCNNKWISDHPYSAIDHINNYCKINNIDIIAKIKEPLNGIITIDIDDVSIFMKKVYEQLWGVK